MQFKLRHYRAESLPAGHGTCTASRAVISCLDSRAAQENSTMAAVLERQQLAVRSTGAALAADVEGVDLAGPLSPETVAAIKQAWGEHLVLRFRGQALSDDDLMRFSRQFGELDWAPVAATNDAPEGREYIMVVSNVVENGQAIGQLGAYEAVWHTDMSYIPEPPMASALYSLEVPPAGGDTGFCNMYLAYETLAP